MATQDQDGDLQRQIEEIKALIQAKEAEAANDRRESEAFLAEAEDYRREAEDYRREAENYRREKEELRRQKELLQKECGPTTFHDNLRNCHDHLYKNLRLEHKRFWSTSITNITGKLYPKVLLPWTDFETNILPTHFGAIDKICGDVDKICGGVRPFPPKSYFVYAGSSIARNSVGTGRQILSFEGTSMEIPVREIIRFAASHEEFQTRYDTTDVYFEQRGKEVSQLDGVASYDKASEADTEQRVVLEAAPKPDNIGMRMRNNGDKCVAFVYDYTAAHKVDVKYVREAVAKPHLFDEVVQRINSAQATADDIVRDREDAEASIATSIVQVYDYMVSFDVPFGYVAAGFTLLLLYVDRNDPQTLFCHPCMPLDVADPIDGSIDLAQTAVVQMLCFCLHSFQTDARPRGSRSLDAAFVRTMASVKTWPVPYMDAPRAGLESPASTTDPSPSTDDSGLMSTEKMSARRISLRLHSSSKTGEVLPWRNADDNDDKDGEGGPSSFGDNSLGDGSDDDPTRQYCTQACLLGLQRGHNLDENCPNVTLHRSGGADVSRHPLDAGQFADLMGQQLRRDPYHKCAIVNYWTKGGAMGWMFKLELLPYGYTLVGKGTVASRLSRLEHEGRIYELLASLQGHLVPVHLGLVDMGRGYIIPGFRFVVHMMLMSWAGEALDYEADKTLVDKRGKAVSTMLRAGVWHGDDCGANYVWNAERGCIMVIDFDHAVLQPMPKPKAVDALARPKRKKRVKADGARKR